jgi:hypothetical protein
MSDKYTASEWAAMQGGHSLEPKNKGLSFMQELGEARMFKSREQISKEGARTLTDHLFVSLMGLYVMSNDYNAAPSASSYARKTSQLGNFNRPSPSGTDLYQTIFSLSRPEMFRNSKDTLLMNGVNIEQARIRQFLKKLERGRITDSEAAQFFYRLERNLKIQNPKLRAARRLTQNWSALTTTQQQLVATQINQYFQMNAIRSDMYPMFKTFAKNNNLLVSDGKKRSIGRAVARKAGAFAAGYAFGKLGGA